ncbi:hypothetical protein CF326_g9436, partial [Tilletia indica]
MSPQDTSTSPAFNRDEHGNVALTPVSYAALMNRISELEARQDATASSQGSSQSSSSFPTSESQDEALSQLQMNAHAGPSAPPAPREHRRSDILTNWRRIIYARAGITDNTTHIWDLPWPRANQWPKHPPSYEEDDIEPVVAGPTGSGGPVLIRKLRVNFEKSYRDEVNQAQFRPGYTCMLNNRRAFGIPADMTREELVSICAVSFDGWQRQYKYSQTPEGRAKKEAANKRSMEASRNKRKAIARWEALQM